MKRKGHQLPKVGALAAGHGRHGEEHHRKEKVVSAPKLLAQEARHGNNDDVGNAVGGHHPTHFLLGGREVAHHLGQGHVHDAGVDKLQQNAENHRHNDNPLGKSGFHGSK
jgi:hypothetical protein